MFGWIERVFHWGVSNVGGTVVGWVRDFFHGFWSFLNGIFGHVSDAWHDMWAEANALWNAAGKFAASVWAGLYHLARIIIPGIVKWANRELHILSKFIAGVWHWAIREFTIVRHWVTHLIDDVIRWAIRHIWDPLFKSLETVRKWIFHEGAIVWFYVTHPDKLIDLVWKSLLAKLEREAWTAGSLLGRFFLALVLHNLKRFALLIEDIVMGVM